MTQGSNTRIAAIVSAHGFGHSARSAAVLEALRAIRPDVTPQIFTTAPRWFFEDSLGGPFDYFHTVTDVGLVQLSPIEEDPVATLAALQPLLPLKRAAQALAEQLRRRECSLALCDISPLGIVAARLAGIPSILVETFTWDWIYRHYLEIEPGLRAVADEMAEVFDSADLRIQPEPVCRAAPGAISVPPVYRRARSTPGEVRQALDVEPGRPMVLITMGGTAWSFEFLDRLAELPQLTFVIFAGTSEIERRGNALLLPDHSPVFVPDLVAASEVVVGKLGYSTVAEAWAAGTRYVYVPRSQFPEGPFLTRFVRQQVPSVELEPETFASGDWLDELPRLLNERRSPRHCENGAERVAGEIERRLPAV